MPKLPAKLKGQFKASGLVVIRATSVVDGDVITKDLNVESGSTFNGRFQVGVTSTSAESVLDDFDDKPKSKPK